MPGLQAVVRWLWAAAPQSLERFGISGTKLMFRRHQELIFNPHVFIGTIKRTVSSRSVHLQLDQEIFSEMVLEILSQEPGSTNGFAKPDVFLSSVGNVNPRVAQRDAHTA